MVEIFKKKIYKTNRQSLFYSLGDLTLQISDAGLI